MVPSQGGEFVGEIAVEQLAQIVYGLERLLLCHVVEPVVVKVLWLVFVNLRPCGEMAHPFSVHFAEQDFFHLAEVFHGGI